MLDAMRVIAGEYRSRVLKAPAGLATRPTSDRLRETLFNVLAPRIAGARFLDLYAGSGAVGIEALSRGAAEVVFVERAAAALAVLRENLSRLGIDRGAVVRPEGVAAFLARRLSATAKTGAPAVDGEFDIAFLDPPYDAAQEYEATLRALAEPRILSAGAVIVAEHRRKDRLEERYGRLSRVRLLEQGDAALSFFAAHAGAAGAA